MLRSTNEFIGSTIEARDGDIGRCHDFLFDEGQWTIRYLVADTRKWLPGRKVLISPYQFGPPESGTHHQSFRVDLTREKIKESPPVDTDVPVSRLYELEMARFYNNRPYWVGDGMWGMGYFPVATEQEPLPPEEWERHAEELRRIEQHHLRSISEVSGYELKATDGGVGKLSDFIVETGSWTIRWAVIDTGGWLSGDRFLISPEWITDVDWHDRTVSVDLLKSEIEKAPRYRPDMPVNREYEGEVYDFYGRQCYWSKTT